MDDSDRKTDPNIRDNPDAHGGSIRPSEAQLRYLRAALEQPGGKLPIFDENGQRIDPKTIRSCISHGWAEPWFENAIKPDWLVCRLTPAGREAARAN